MTVVATPVYVETRRQAGGKPPLYVARPLFAPVPETRHSHLQQALANVRKTLKRSYEEWAGMSRQQVLAAALYAPAIVATTLKLSLTLKSRTAKTRMLFVEISGQTRRIAFTPSVSDFWFELDQGESLETRATEALTDYFRQLDKRGDVPIESPHSPESLSLHGEAWIAQVDVEFRRKFAKPIDPSRLLASLFGAGAMNGGDELDKVGRCLDDEHPDGLKRALLRDREVAELSRLLRQSDRRPIAIVGPRLVGKSAVLEETIFQRAAAREKTRRRKGLAYRLSPQRLVAGMMYVGQWENRLEAICKFAAKRDHILCFDDFLGLYQAGKSRDADLAMADVLRPRIVKRQFRVVAEFTPEAFDRFKERDRGLADQFHVVPIPPTDDEQSWRILTAYARTLEAEHRMKFAIDAPATTMDYARRFIRDAALPGKAAAALRDLAVRADGSAPGLDVSRAIGHDAAADSFARRIGVSGALLSDNAWARRDLVTGLSRRVSGQPHVVETMADVVSIAKAGLNPPDRPIAVMLFMGPTGVGKTHCAKVLAETLYDDAARLLRFDMNEHQTASAVARLVGGGPDGDGLLTGAVRRQPFSLVLLDEIEKAHPDVFDLLLQVAGEGRLTDAGGRTSDFTQCVIVMTSNLGALDAARRTGFARDEIGRRQTYVEAAERFFRPEFFNRVDHLLAFDSLDRPELLEIARSEFHLASARDGLVRRRSFVRVDERALEKVVDAGFHPQLGARAIKRAVERELVQPMARALAALPPDRPAIATVMAGPTGVLTRVDGLEDAPQTKLSASSDAAAVVAQTDAFLRRAGDEAVAWQERMRAAGGTNALSPERLAYFALKEQLHVAREARDRLRDLVKATQRAAERPARRTTGVSGPSVPTRAPVSGYRQRNPSAVTGPQRRLHLASFAADDIETFFREAAQQDVKPVELDTARDAAVAECVLAQTLIDSVGAPQRALLVLRPLRSSSAARWAGAYTESSNLGVRFRELFGTTLSFRFEQLLPSRVSQRSLEAFCLGGPGLAPLLAQEEGLHVWWRRGEPIDPYQALVMPIDDEVAAADALDQAEDRVNAWSEAVAAGTASLADDPWPMGKIVRYYDQDGPVVDVRTGRAFAQWPSVEEMKSLLLAGLPVPREFVVLHDPRDAAAERPADERLDRGEPS